MIIRSRFKEYSLAICYDKKFLLELMKDVNTFFVIDKKLYTLYVDTVFCGLEETKFLLVEAIEENKTIDTVLKICEIMTVLPQKRNIHLVSVGGGIIQDITGLVSNILYRGIRWTFIPTTLLAACDSCIGGKTSLNYKNYKNLLGTFYPPDKILIYPHFFQTLTNYDFGSGLGEIVKFSALRGMNSIEKLNVDIKRLLAREEKILEEYILSSLEFKKGYIEEDEFDKGIRIHLNFAHTFGHAIESVTKYEVPHGTAVAMGMVVANRISMKRGLLYIDIINKVENLVKKILFVKYDLKQIVVDQIVDAMKKDKKQVDKNISVILLDRSMQLIKVNDITEEEIKESFEYLTLFLEEI